MAGHCARGGRAYDLTVHGANGYLAQARGARHEGLEVSLKSIPAQRRLRLQLHNSGAAARAVHVNNVYAPADAAVHTLAAGAVITLGIDLNGSQGWYDVSVTREDSPDYLRRFAGHREDGNPATSDPGVLSSERIVV